MISNYTKGARLERLARASLERPDRRKLASFPAPPVARKQFWQRADDGGWKVTEIADTTADSASNESGAGG